MEARIAFLSVSDEAIAAVVASARTRADVATVGATTRVASFPSEEFRGLLHACAPNLARARGPAGLHAVTGQAAERRAQHLPMSLVPVAENGKAAVDTAADELGRLQLMVMQYAQLALEARLSDPGLEGSTEQHQIPTDLGHLRSGIDARKQYMSSAAGFVAQHQAPSFNDAASLASAGPAVQSELARLRFQLDSLREENAAQAAELSAASGALAGVGQARAAGASTPFTEHPT